MAIQLYIGYIGEGNTDEKFLPHIIHNSFTEVAFDCHTDIEVEDVVNLHIEKGSFVEMMMKASKNSYENGISVLCIHADADKKSLNDVLANKFMPLTEELCHLDDKIYCKNIVAVIPITETEAWMLADKELLKKEIGAKDRSDADLGIEKFPEIYAQPKEVIEDAIRIAQQHKTKKRRRELTISDLYEVLGQSIDVNKLRQLPSYCNFENNIRSALVKLGYLRP